MPNFKGNSGGGPSTMKMYGKGKNPIMLTKEAQTKIMASDANPKFKKAIANSPIEMYKKSPNKKYGKSSMKYSPAKGVVSKLLKGVGGIFTAGGSKFGAVNMIKKQFKK